MRQQVSTVHSRRWLGCSTKAANDSSASSVRSELTDEDQDDHQRSDGTCKEKLEAHRSSAQSAAKKLHITLPVTFRCWWLKPLDMEVKRCRNSQRDPFSCTLLHYSMTHKGL
ncbi:uncharacterized protein V6R79_022770 [Siganus canaliculatus]